MGRREGDAEAICGRRRNEGTPIVRREKRKAPGQRSGKGTVSLRIPSPQNRACDFHRTRLKQSTPIASAPVTGLTAPPVTFTRLSPVPNFSLRFVTFPSLCKWFTRPTSARFRVGYSPIWPVRRGTSAQFPLPFGRQPSLLGPSYPARAFRLPYGRPTRCRDTNRVSTFSDHERR